MEYEVLSYRLGIEPSMLAEIFKEGIDKQYTREPKIPRGRVLRGGRTKGKPRNIIVPRKNLRDIQRKIAYALERRFTPHPIAHGYVKTRSISSNATVHVGATLLLKIDLINFFGSIKRKAVNEVLGRTLNLLSKRNIEAIGELCCYEEGLPQGSPASPILSNMVCYSLDVEINRLAASLGCKVSRFSDDISFSTFEPIFPVQLVQEWTRGGPLEIELGADLPALFASHGFEINPDKLRVQSRGGRMQVTGINVGESDISVPREFRDNVRASLHRWDKSNLADCAGRQDRAGCTRSFVNGLRGCIAHVGNVEGTDRLRFRRLLGLFQSLLDRDRAQLCPIVDHRRQVCKHGH